MHGTKTFVSVDENHLSVHSSCVVPVSIWYVKQNPTTPVAILKVRPYT